MIMTVHSGILKGITRHTILNLLNSAHIKAEAKIVLKDEIPRFDEAFICSTVRGLIPINKIDNHVLHTTREKSIFNQIKGLFHTWVSTNIGESVDWNTGRAHSRETLN